MDLRLYCPRYFITIILFILLVSANFLKSNAETIEDVHKLLTDLVDVAKYDRRIRGVHDQTNALDVQASFMFQTIEHFGVESQALESMGVFTLTWVDERLKWEPSDYNGTSRIHVYQNEIWRPEVSVSNPSQEVTLLGNDRIMLEVHNTGIVFWKVGDIFKTSCPVKVTAYPWDKQECEIRFVVQGYIAREVRLLAGARAVCMDYYVPNGQWDIISHRTVEQNRDVPQLKLIFILERRAIFDIVILIVPTLTLSVLNMLVFFLPVQSGERMSYSITVLLSIAVLLTFVGDMLPNKSDNVAAICYCIMNILIMSAVICACTLFSLYLYHKGDDGSKPPRWIIRILCLCGRNRCCQHSAKTNHTQENDSRMNEPTNTEARLQHGEVDEWKKDIQSDAEIAGDWVAVSRWVDSVCFTVMVLWLVAAILSYTLAVRAVRSEI